MSNREDVWVLVGLVVVVKSIAAVFAGPVALLPEPLAVLFRLFH